MPIRIALLGEVTAQAGARPVDLGPPRQRCVLAALAVDAGQLVPVDRLVDRVWGADTPRRGRATLHSHISRLRGAFAGTLTIARRSDGYALEVGQEELAVDLLRFRALREQAECAGDDARTVALLTEAVALWRGEPLTGLSGEWVEAERDRWQQELWAAEQDLVDAQLRTGQGEELVARLRARGTRHPLDERVAGQYMLALHRAGRSADALDHFRRLRDSLIEELGTEPRGELQELHRRILAADPGLSAAPGPGPGVTVAPMPPRQLPAAPALFVGRREELDRLDAVLAPGGPGDPVALISAIGGAGGIGKTWLALRWAHRHLDRFPDGQLFADLHGFSPAEQPARPVDVLGGFLEALGVGREHQPTGVEGRAGLYRTLVADRRLLVVLDNAATTEQVAALLPGGRHCTVLVTGRTRLRGLIARHGARPVPLDVLTDAEARTLLATALGPGRATAASPALAELAELCGGLPLALGLIAARAAADPRLPLGDVVADLRTLGVEALDSEDPTASLPTVLSWSLRHLTEQQRTAFALLSIAPGPDIGLPAAACLTGLAEREAHATVQALADASLLDRLPTGRYGMHDLVRAYATTVAAELPGEVRETALHRVLDFYARTVHAADRLLNPHRDPVPLDLPEAHAHPLPDAAAALAWCDAEHACLLAAQQTAAAHQWHATVWHLAWGLHTFHYRRGHRHDHLAVWQAAADAAEHLPGPDLVIFAHQALGLTYGHLDRHEDALRHLHQALTFAEQHDAVSHKAHTHRLLARAWSQQGDDRKALDHARCALHLYRGLDQPVGEADALNSVGWRAARLGDYETAREHCQAALALHKSLRDPTGEAATEDSLGYIDHHSGHHERAIAHYERAITMLRDLGNTYETPGVLESSAHPHLALGDRHQARKIWREALRLFREQGRHDDVHRVQARLDDL